MIIESLIRTYLCEKLNMDRIYPETPNDISGNMIIYRVIERGLENYLNSVTVEFFSYADSKLEAAELDESLREAMLAFCELDAISASQLGGGSDDMDSTLKKYRYRAYFNIYY